MGTQSIQAPVLPNQPKEPFIKIKVLWKWSFVFLLALVAWGMWQCSSGVRMTYQLADPAVQQFHRQLDAGQYEVICSQAAPGFCASGAASDAMQVLKGVHEKLGDTVSSKRGAWNVGSTTSGTFVRIQYNTAFALGPGVETFTWIKSANTFKLYGYNIQSNALLKPANTPLKPAAKSLYFVPIGDAPTTEMSKLIAHYQEKFGIEARMLPAVAPSANDMDQNRQQLIAESLIQTMLRDYSNLATDGSSVLIGITRQDMYPRGEGWQFCFGWRITDARAAIVSTARMNLDYPGEVITEATLEQRLRKTVTKDIAILYYGMSPNENPESVLYSGILGIQELDRVKEEF